MTRICISLIFLFLVVSGNAQKVYLYFFDAVNPILENIQSAGRGKIEGSFAVYNAEDVSTITFLEQPSKVLVDSLDKSEILVIHQYEDRDFSEDKTPANSGRQKHINQQSKVPGVMVRVVAAGCLGSALWLTFANDEALNGREEQNRRRLFFVGCTSLTVSFFIK